MKHTIILTAQLPSPALELLSQECDVVVHAAAGRRTEEDMVHMFGEADGAITLVTDPVTRDVLASNPNLRIVANYGVGTDNVDLDAARELGIRVTNTPGVLTEATADLAMTLILAVTRRVIEGDRMIREKAFHGWEPLMLLGTSLNGKRLGIIGMGRIGFALATRARAFGLEIVYHSRSRNAESERTHQSRQVSLEELLGTSDLVSLHLPLTSETRHLINPASLRLFKKGSYLINTARGPIVDESALADAIESGALRGAGLDVYEREPAVDARLLTQMNVVLLPHLGSATEETRREMARMAAMNVLTFFRTGQPLNTVV